MQRQLVALEEAHPLAASGNQQSLGVGPVQQLAPGRLQALAVMDAPSQRRLGLRLIGRQRGHALKAVEVAMRIHDNNLASVARKGDRGLDDFGADDARLIVRENQRVHARDGRAQVAEHLFLANIAQIGVVDDIHTHDLLAHQLAIAREDARLGGGWASLLAEDAIQRDVILRELVAAIACPMRHRRSRRR